jgi:hypothetical protein
VKLWEKIIKTISLSTKKAASKQKKKEEKKRGTKNKQNYIDTEREPFQEGVIFFLLLRESISFLASEFTEYSVVVVVCNR